LAHFRFAKKLISDRTPGDGVIWYLPVFISRCLWWGNVPVLHILLCTTYHGHVVSSLVLSHSACRNWSISRKRVCL